MLPSIKSSRGCVKLAAALLVTSFSSGVWAHCDSLDGPVIKDARVALDKGDVTPVLKWVKKDHEGEVRDVFKQALTVRGKGSDAKSLADRFFFETLVRVHREGEGAPYTGLKPADSVDKGIEAADVALHSGSVKKLANNISSAISEGVEERFKVVLERKKHAAHSVETGREYVEAYVDYVHFVEGVHNLATHGVSHGHEESAAHVD